VSGMSLLASNTATPLSARQLALEFLVTLAEEAPAMCRYVTSSRSSIPHSCIAAVLHLYTCQNT
jgi:Importin repeat